MVWQGYIDGKANNKNCLENAFGLFDNNEHCVIDIAIKSRFKQQQHQQNAMVKRKFVICPSMGRIPHGNKTNERKEKNPPNKVKHSFVVCASPFIFFLHFFFGLLFREIDSKTCNSIRIAQSASGSLLLLALQLLFCAPVISMQFVEIIVPVA